jgi:hypothetical protein
MNKLVLMVVLLLLLTHCVSADVTISVVDKRDGSATIMYDAGAGPLVRAFALDITVEKGTIDAISGYIRGESTAANPGFGIFPGNFNRHITVDPDTSEVADWSIAAYTPVADAGDPGALGGLGTAGITIEMGALYYPADDASPESPPAAGELCTVTVSEDCTMSIALNELRGGVVLTDTSSATVVLTSGPVHVDSPCDIPRNHPKYEEFVAVGSPSCWLYSRQCQGDADGRMGGNAKTGYYYVGPEDLNILVSAWLVKERPHGPSVATVENGICADFARDKGGSAKTGFYRVGPTDLNILIQNWLVKEPPHGPGVPATCGGDI